jgi:hypothetical protein
MRPLGVLLSIVIVMGAFCGTVWIARYSPWAPKYERKKMRWEAGAEAAAAIIKRNDDIKAGKVPPPETKKGEEPLVDPRPVIADKGPFPKAVSGQRTFEFKNMAVDEHQQHKFTIENKGEASLKLGRGPTTCKCTISTLAKDDIPPGGSADIEMSWTPREAKDNFDQTATIWTNDPESPEMRFKVMGKVVKQFVMEPEHTWVVGPVTDIVEGKTSGRIASQLDRNFDILSIESMNPAIKTEVVPLKPAILTREGYMAGYDVKVTVGQDMPMGHFKSRLRIHTNLEGDKIIDVEIKGSRSGPILFLPPTPVGQAAWNLENFVLNMGRFDHTKGRKVYLPALIYGELKEKLQIVGVDSEDKNIKVSLEPNSEIGGNKQHGYRLVFEVLPSATPETRVSPEEAHVTVKTNYSRLKELPFKVEFIAQ